MANLIHIKTFDNSLKKELSFHLNRDETVEVLEKYIHNNPFYQKFMENHGQDKIVSNVEIEIRAFNKE
jgi:hypothetical protein